MAVRLLVKWRNTVSSLVFKSDFYIVFQGWIHSKHYWKNNIFVLYMLLFLLFMKGLLVSGEHSHTRMATLDAFFFFFCVNTSGSRHKRYHLDETPVQHNALDGG